MGGVSGKITNINLPFKKKSGDKAYIRAVETLIPSIISYFRPDFIVYQAGVDGFYQDKLGNLNLTLDGLFKRDVLIRQYTKDFPTAVLTGGGYAKDSFKAHVNTLAAFLDEERVYSSPKEVTEPRTTMTYLNKNLRAILPFFESN